MSAKSKESRSSSLEQIWGNFDPTTMPTLRGLLEQPAKETIDSSRGETIGSGQSETSTGVSYARAAQAMKNVNHAHYASASSGHLISSMSTTSRPTSKQNNPTLYFKDTTHHRGEKIGVHTLAKYLTQEKIYDVESFIEHATQGPSNRGTELYLKLAMKDWDKKIQQALDIARSFTPDTSYRTRVENYRQPKNLDKLTGDYTYQEYWDLFNHHGIKIEKIQKWFQTLFGDNGKRNTIYMWGKADAGKTTIIKLFDAFYSPWEIGRCSAQSINSNF